ncbi:ABC transporter ATP-binding protein [Novosphingobium sp. RD2P27]|uniref:ABC transporter ATP-binding protein n=1 Tax=Novosphingobium kalidii TaxID=3230299 RepID=A0ABV2CZ77_9SPHN
MTRALALEHIVVADRLDAITATFAAGEVTAICGPNGAGKSTLLTCLAGLLEPDAGTVLLGDAPLFRMPAADRARAIGYLPQAPEVAWDLSVETLISLGRLPWRGAPAGEAQAAIDAAITAMDLEALRTRAVSRLSGGERARALMARVLATRPAWLLADEPLANLDLAHAASLMRRFREQAGEGRGVVLVLHDLATAMNHADRVLVLDRGHLAADGPPEQALSEAVIRRVWAVEGRWLGEPGAQALALG